MLQCATKNVKPSEWFVSQLPVAEVLPEILNALKQSPQVNPHGFLYSFSNSVNLKGAFYCWSLVELLLLEISHSFVLGKNTRLEVVTEGILTRLIQHNPELTGIDLVILDEFHERSLQADLALALVVRHTSRI
ncbi:unnamed protein product [Ranitomeya imitator]|uniref:Uncharacterized protein n=1 Tax=Ranitomeya imitator TaxID=111125 RepID=A0ABN9M2B3_9NEOB|nr:unnamed protein product [Ranitomeya imitator]